MPKASLRDYPFGLLMPGRDYQGGSETKEKFTGKERDAETGLDYFGARYYSSALGRWLAVDPLMEKFPSGSPYTYTINEPIILTDLDGREPVKKYASTLSTFIKMFNNTPSKIGQKSGAEAVKALIYLQSTEWNWKQMRPLPKATPYFNNKKGRYIYTKDAGWLDMVHFLFYAGRTYKYKISGVDNPIGEALQGGYLQEALDPKYSKYSYEDLPSDLLGAVFAYYFFDPELPLTLSEQIEIFLLLMRASDPEDAPNYKELPEKHHKNKPTHINKTTTPMFTIPYEKKKDSGWEAKYGSPPSYQH